MKNRLALVALASLLALTPAIRLFADAPATAAPITLDSSEAEIKTLFDAMIVKIQDGHRTAVALADDLKAMDALVDRYRTILPEQAAKVTLMKAGLYDEIFEDQAGAVAILKKLKTEFPKSDAAGRVDEFVAVLEARIRADARLAIGQVFPDFAEKDLNGQPLSVAAYKGKFLLIDFWATWCGPCVAELPNVLAAYGKYHDKGFEIVGISLDQDRAALTAFIQDNKMPWQQYFDGQGWKNKLARANGIESIPATFLLDGDGRIVAKNLRGEALDEKLATLLAH